MWRSSRSILRRSSPSSKPDAPSVFGSGLNTRSSAEARGGYRQHGTLGDLALDASGRAWLRRRLGVDVARRWWRRLAPSDEGTMAADERMVRAVLGPRALSAAGVVREGEFRTCLV